MERKHPGNLFVRDCITEALFKLMKSKDFNDITVSMLVKTAGVSRNSFYQMCIRDRYTSVWYEDPDYREELLVRDYNTGEVLERIPGSLRSMPDGQNWLLV